MVDTVAYGEPDAEKCNIHLNSFLRRLLGILSWLLIQEQPRADFGVQ